MHDSIIQLTLVDTSRRARFVYLEFTAHANYYLRRWTDIQVHDITYVYLLMYIALVSSFSVKYECVGCHVYAPMTHEQYELLYIHLK